MSKPSIYWNEKLGLRELWQVQSGIFKVVIKSTAFTVLVAKIQIYFLDNFDMFWQCQGKIIKKLPFVWCWPVKNRDQTNLNLHCKTDKSVKAPFILSFKLAKIKIQKYFLNNNLSQYFRRRKITKSYIVWLLWRCKMLCPLAHK